MTLLSVSSIVSIVVSLTLLATTHEVSSVVPPNNACNVSVFGPSAIINGTILLCKCSSNMPSLEYSWQFLSVPWKPILIDRNYSLSVYNVSLISIKSDIINDGSYICNQKYETNMTFSPNFGRCQINPVNQQCLLQPSDNNGVVEMKKGNNKTLTVTYSSIVTKLTVEFIPVPYTWTTQFSCFSHGEWNLTKVAPALNTQKPTLEVTSQGPPLPTVTPPLPTVTSPLPTVTAPPSNKPPKRKKRDVTSSFLSIRSATTTVDASSEDDATTGEPMDHSFPPTIPPGPVEKPKSEPLLYHSTVSTKVVPSEESCVFQSVPSPGNKKFVITFKKFQESCNGIYRFIPSASEPVFSVYVRYKKDVGGDDGDDEDGDNNKRTDVAGITLGVLFTVLVCVTAVVVVKLVKKRRLAQRARCQMKNKMVSTISGCKVQFFNNMAFGKEQDSELEEFPRKNIRFLNTVGKGTFGTVVMAEALNLLKKKKGPMSRNWATVAVKMTLISEKSNEELKKDFLSELALMKSIPSHTNIITLYASCTAHDPYLMILEYAQHGDLRKFLLEHRMERNYANAAFSAYGVGKDKLSNAAARSPYGSYSKKDKSEGNIYAVPGQTGYSDLPSRDSDLVTSRDLLSFALQISRGLEHLMRNKIVHRDVAARNVLLFEHNIVKISDFGLARKLDQSDVYERTRKGLLPIRWMSPESLFYNQFTEKSDVWSFGVLMWELITLGSTPYPGLDSTTVLEKIKERDLLVCPPHSSTVVNNMVLSCWGDDAQKRPTFYLLCQELEQLLEAEVEYVDLDQMNDHEYSTLDGLGD